jgi:hypothetical protein
VDHGLVREGPIKTENDMAHVMAAKQLGAFFGQIETLATPEPTKDWSLTTLKELIKIDAKVVSHGRNVAIQMAEVAISQHLFADMLRLIAEPRPPPDLAPA